MAYPNEKRKNRAGVEAFGTGKPPQPVTTGALTNRRSGRVGGVKSRRRQPAQQDNSDIDAIFRGAREMRGMVRRGMSGAQLNPDGSDPGNGFNQFLKNNPHLDTREKRQNQYAMENQQRIQQIQQQGPEAVAARRHQQELERINNSGPREISTPYGSGSVSFPDTRTRGTMPDPLTGKTVYMDQYLPQQSDVQDTKSGANAEEAGDNYFNPSKATIRPQMAGRLPSRFRRPISGIDQIFPGQSSPPGDRAGSSLVGAGSALGAPGGDFQMGQVPSFQSSGMPIPQASLPDDTPGAASLAARQQAFPKDKMTQYEPPFSNPNQLDALRRLSGLFGQQSPASAGLESIWTNMIPGQNDWDYLATLFPGLVKKGAGASSNMRNLQTLYQDPVYQARF